MLQHFLHYCHIAPGHGDIFFKTISNHFDLANVYAQQCEKYILLTNELPLKLTMRSGWNSMTPTHTHTVVIVVLNMFVCLGTAGSRLFVSIMFSIGGHMEMCVVRLCKIVMTIRNFDGKY